MRKATKIWLIIATFLVIAGLISFTAVMAAYNWDFAKLSTGKYETNTYVIGDAFSNISINTDTADIRFALSEDESCRVECYEAEKETHSVAVQEDTLVINKIDDRQWYDHIGIHFGSPKITVYLSKAEFAALAIDESTGGIEIPNSFNFKEATISLSTGNVDFTASVSGLTKIKTSTGHIHVENTSVGILDIAASTGEITVSNVTCAGDASIRVSTGKTNLNNFTCKNLISTGNTGEIFLHAVLATEKFSIERSTGDVRFDSSDAAEIFVETDTGDVVGSLLTHKVFITETDTGRIHVPKTTMGGRCEITTDTGDIKITVESPLP